jgi:hypothetical protein
MIPDNRPIWETGGAMSLERTSTVLTPASHLAPEFAANQRTTQKTTIRKIVRVYGEKECLNPRRL